MTWICRAIVLAIALTVQSAQADEAEDQYLQIVDLIQSADALNAKGQTRAAMAKYQEAQAALRTFRRARTDWNTTMVAYRLKYLAEKIQACTEKANASAENLATSDQSKPPSGTLAGAVRLIDAGTEPRKAIRLHPKAGDRQSVAVEIKTATTTKIGDMATPAMKLPMMTMNVDVTIQDVSDQGDISYNAVVIDATVAEEAGVLPQAADAMKSALAGLKGIASTGTMTSRGSSKALEIKAPAGTDPQTQQTTELVSQSFAAFAVPLPEEPIGPGAHWETKAPVKAQGITYDQTTTYQLVSVDGESLVLKSVVSQSASNQKIQSPAMPGLKLDLTKMTGKGNGDIASNTARLLPEQVVLDTHSELTMGMNAGGQKQTLTMNVDVNMRIQSK